MADSDCAAHAAVVQTGERPLLEWGGATHPPRLRPPSCLVAGPSPVAGPPENGPVRRRAAASPVRVVGSETRGATVEVLSRCGPGNGADVVALALGDAPQWLRAEGGNCAGEPAHPSGADDRSPRTR